MKTMRKLLIAPLALLLVFIMTIPIVASPRVLDNAGFLTYNEQNRLNAELAEISQRHSNDVAIVTMQGHGTVRQAQQFYNQMGLRHDGIILLLSVDNQGARYLTLATQGFSGTAFTERGLDRIESRIVRYIRNDNYYAAFSLFAELADGFLEDARAGNIRHNSGYTPVVAIICTAIAMAIALAIVFGMKSGHRSAKPQRAACNYVRAGSFNLTTQRDLFLFRRITKVARAQSSGGGGGRGGRSGGSFGGRSRRI